MRIGVDGLKIPESAKRGPIGSLLDEWFGIVFAFRWTGAVLASALMGFPLMVRSAEASFELLNLPFRNQLPVSSRLNGLLNVPILFVQASDDPELSTLTREMFLKAPEPREQAIIGHGNFVSMNDEDKRAYETRVVQFFLTRLPATGNVTR